MAKKKLKRGLKDVSPIFSEKKKQRKIQSTVKEKSHSTDRQKSINSCAPTKKTPSVLTPSGVHSVCVFSPGHPSASKSIAKAIAKQMIPAKGSHVVVQIKPESDIQECLSQEETTGLIQAQMSWAELQEVRSVAQASFTQDSEIDQLVFLAIDELHLCRFEEASKFVDKWVLHIDGTFESLKEAFRLIKMTQKATPNSDYYLLFDGDIKDPKGARLFEKFAYLISEELGVQLTCLGRLKIQEEGIGKDGELQLENLFLKSMSSKGNMAKHLLIHELKRRVQSHSKVAFS